MEAASKPPPNSNHPLLAVNGNGNGASALAKPQQYHNPYRTQRPPLRGRGRRRRSCFWICCLWLTLLFIALALLAVIAARVFYIIYRPQRPSFSVSSFCLAALNLSSDDLLTSRLDLSLGARNPNRHLAIVYDDVAVSASSGGVAIGEGTIPGFVQGADNTTALKATVSCSGRSLDPAEASDLRRKKRYPLEIEIDTKAGVKFGGFKSKRIGIKASCEGIEAAVAKGNTTAAGTSSANCKVKLRIRIWKWTI